MPSPGDLHRGTTCPPLVFSCQPDSAQRQCVRGCAVGFVKGFQARTPPVPMKTGQQVLAARPRNRRWRKGECWTPHTHYRGTGCLPLGTSVPPPKRAKPARAYGKQAASPGRLIKDGRYGEAECPALDTPEGIRMRPPKRAPLCRPHSAQTRSQEHAL